MHDLFLAGAFLAMLLLPCLFSQNVDAEDKATNAVQANKSA
jgi:hypothetical protein